MATKTAPTGMTVTLKLYGEDGRKLLHREVELNPNTKSRRRFTRSAPQRQRQSTARSMFVPPGRIGPIGRHQTSGWILISPLRRMPLLSHKTRPPGKDELETSIPSRSVRSRRARQAFERRLLDARAPGRSRRLLRRIGAGLGVTGAAHAADVPLTVEPRLELGRRAAHAGVKIDLVVLRRQEPERAKREDTKPRLGGSDHG